MTAEPVALACDLVEQLIERGLTVTAAESCTGGWIAKCLTDVPGSSAVFGFGFVSYSNTAKQSLLGVNGATLEAHGAVSEPVVREMAEGALARAGADLAVAVSGIAGPGGGSAEKPVGTVCFAWVASGTLESSTEVFEGDRDSVRGQSVEHALKGLAARLP